MSLSAPALHVPPVTSPRQKTLVRFAWGVLAYNIAVILWGSVVRATSSGAGCGEHWPLCNGSVVQHHPQVATLIELAHRMTSGVALLLMIGLLVWTWRQTARGHLARVAVAAAAILTFNEALLGALLVLLGKVAHDQSASRGVYLSLHLANTLLLLAALTLTAHFLARERGYMRGSVDYHSLAPVSAGLFATLLVGVSGSLAALGDTLFPAENLRAAFAQDFSSSSSWLLRLRWLHPAMSLLAGAFILWLLLKGARRNQGLAAGVTGLLLLQYFLGIADVLLRAPVWMQVVHLFGADLLWVALITLTAHTCILPAGCPGNICSTKPQQ